MRTLILALALAGLAACAQLGFVATANLSGTGAVWTDGAVLVALGELEGDFTVYSKQPGIQVFFPTQVQEGQVTVINQATGEELHLALGEPLPAYCRSLFRPGEAEALGLTFSPE